MASFRDAVASPPRSKGVSDVPVAQCLGVRLPCVRCNARLRPPPDASRTVCVPTSLSDDAVGKGMFHPADAFHSTASSALLRFMGTRHKCCCCRAIALMTRGLLMIVKIHRQDDGERGRLLSHPQQCGTRPSQLVMAVQLYPRRGPTPRRRWHDTNEGQAKAS